MFSIGYGQKNDGSYAAFRTEPTISMVRKDLGVNRQFFAISYVIGNKGRSSLASGNNGFRTHDVHDRKRVNGICQSPAILHVTENKARIKLAPGGDRFGTHDVAENAKVYPEMAPFGSYRSSNVGSLYVASSLCVEVGRAGHCRSRRRPKNRQSS